MKKLLYTTAFIAGVGLALPQVLATETMSSQDLDELTTLLKQHQGELEFVNYLKDNPEKGDRLCQLIMGYPDSYFQAVQKAGLGIFRRNEITHYCQSRTEFEKVVTKAPARQEKAIPKEEIDTGVEGFVNNYNAYARYFDENVKPRDEDIAELKGDYFNFEVTSRTGLQEHARQFVRDGSLRRLLKENPGLVGAIAQMQAYYSKGQGSFKYYRSTGEGMHNPNDVVLKYDYENPYGARARFDVTIYSLFLTILEQADKQLPKDEETYEKLLEEIKKGIRVRKLMRK